MIMRLLFIILFAILLPVNARAQAPLNSAPLPNTAEINAEKIAIGTLIATEGSVTRLDSTGEALPLTAKAPLHLHDVIETGEDARALIVLIDNSEFTLGENAQFTIDEYIFDDQNDALNRGRYSVLRGAFLYVSGLIAKKADPRHDPDVIVNTPAASIGIRGTAFWGGEIDGAYGVLVTDGQVNVQTQRGRINVDKDTGTTIISKNDTPARATAWDAEKINRAVATITMKNPEDARARITENAPTQAAQLAAYKEYLIKHYEQQKLLKDNRTPSTRIDNRAQPATKEEGTTAKTPPASVPTPVQKPAAPTAPVQPAPVTPAQSAPAPALAPAPEPSPALDQQLQKLNEEIKDKGSENVRSGETMAPSAPVTPPATGNGKPQVDLPNMNTDPLAPARPATGSASKTHSAL